MRYPWLFAFPLVAFFAIIIYSVYRYIKSKDVKKRHRNASLVAHTRAIRELPEYKKAQRRYRLLLWLTAIVFVISISSAVTLASRPVTITESKYDQYNRDIMLCLDISGSMQNIIGHVLDYFKNMTKDLMSERIGLVVFNGAYLTLLPLTDDYSAVAETLNEVNNNYHNLSASTLVGRSSEIGLGLAGCVSSFDQINNEGRSRFIIFATDNNTEFSEQQISLKKASQLAKNNSITVYGLYTGEEASQDVDKNEVEFSDAISLTGGIYSRINNSKVDYGSTRIIIDDILKAEAKKHEKSGELIRTDTPKIAAILFSVSTIMLIILLWRLRI